MGKCFWVIALALGSCGAIKDFVDEETLASKGGAASEEREAIKVVVGEFHACAILAGGVLKCWGGNDYGQLGQGHTNDLGDQAGELEGLSPVVLSDNNGTPGDTSDDIPRTVVDVALGQVHTCAVLDNGSVKCWGGNDYGQLGQGHTNYLGDEAGEMANIPAVVLSDNNGTPGDTSDDIARTATAVGLGEQFSCALLDNGSVKCWGGNTQGELGQGDTNSRGHVATGSYAMINVAGINLGTGLRATALAAGSTHVCAVLNNNTLKCWGRNAQGQLGQGSTTTLGDNTGEMGDNLSAINLGTGRTVAAVAVGKDHNCALLDNASIKCWGNNAGGKLGYGHTTTLGDNVGEMGDNLAAVNLGSGRTVRSISVGESHSCALLGDNALKCWGYNSKGQLGQGHANNLGDQGSEMGDILPAIDLGSNITLQAIAAGGDQSCVVVNYSALKCWGENASGVLGLGDTQNRGDNPGEMGDNLPTLPL